MSNDGICHPVFADLHCHRFLGTGADQKSLAGSQEIYVLILALPPKGTVSVGSVQQKQSLWRICKSRTSRVTKWEAESIIFCPVDSGQPALRSRPSSTCFATTVRCPALYPTTSPENCLEEKASWKVPLPYNVELISFNALLGINIHKAMLPPKGSPTS